MERILLFIASLRLMILANMFSTNMRVITSVSVQTFGCNSILLVGRVGAQDGPTRPDPHMVTTCLLPCTFGRGKLNTNQLPNRCIYIKKPLLEIWMQVNDSFRKKKNSKVCVCGWKQRLKTRALNNPEKANTLWFEEDFRSWFFSDRWRDPTLVYSAA